jgi:hypothetical protein
VISPIRFVQQGVLTMKLIIGMVLLAGLAMFTGESTLQDSPSTDEMNVTMVAYVMAQYTDESELVGIELEDDEGLRYRVVLDEQGRRLAAAHDGEWVNVEGTTMERDGDNWFKVRSFSMYLDKGEDEDGYFGESEGWEDDQRWDDPDAVPDDDGDAEDADEQGAELDGEEIFEPIADQWNGGELDSWPDEPAADDSLTDEIDETLDEGRAGRVH